jgi:FkbM family methyltransferase
MLLSQGFVQILWIHQLYEIHDPFRLSRNVFTDDVPPEQDRNIEAARQLFRDELSRAVFDRFIETHRTKTPVLIPRSQPDEQYFPRDIDMKIPLDRMVLCGSDIHDLIRLSHKIDSPIESLISFEADPYLFRKLSDHRFLSDQIGSLNEMTRYLMLSPCAISSSTGIRSFSSANRPSSPSSCNTFGSRLHPRGADLVQTVSLDQAIHGLEPTYVCMDIEGEELEAISGTRRIIRSSRTQLAVSVYHKASHIWEIPNLIHTINPNYTFHLRNYTGFCLETILYATI